MQKKIIALAIAASFSAPACAEVGWYGVVDAAIASVTAKGQKSDVIVLAGGASASRIGVKATEDLGDGLTGVVILEYGLDTETSATFGAARQQMLAVVGGYGTLATGYLQTAGYDWANKYDPVAGSSVSSLQVVANKTNFLIGTNAAASRASRAFAYISPNLNGLVFAANYSTALSGLGNLTLADSNAAAAAGLLKTTAYLLSADYEMGPYSAGVAYAATANASANPNTFKEWALGGSYDFGVAKLFGTYQSDTPTIAGISGNAVKAYSLSGVMPVETGSFVLTYAASKMSLANSNGSSVSVGYLHILSKSTTAYAAYQSVSNGSATGAYSADNNTLSTAPGVVAVGGSSSVLAVGLRKRF